MSFESWVGGLREVKAELESWRGKRVLVAGDMMLDEYLYGTTDRVSREAPVLIVKYDRSEYRLGGAANAARNVAALGGRPEVFGLAGRDEAGTRMKEMMKDAGIRISGLSLRAGRTTTSKTRILAGDYHAQRQQIARIDREQNKGATKAEAGMLLERIAAKIAGAGALILSDYGQGTVSREMIEGALELAGRNGVPVVADSRFRLVDFRGVTTATPNEVEAAEASGIEIDGMDTLEKAGRKLMSMLSCESLLITRGRYGMALFQKNASTVLDEVVGSSEATDVTGAGDTVASAVALSLAAGSSMAVAMRMANLAASVVVMKRGAAVASPDEVLSAAGKLAGADGGGL